MILRGYKLAESLKAKVKARAKAEADEIAKLKAERDAARDDATRWMQVAAGREDVHRVLGIPRPALPIQWGEEQLVDVNGRELWLRLDGIACKIHIGNAELMNNPRAAEFAIEALVARMASAIREQLMKNVSEQLQPPQRDPQWHKKQLYKKQVIYRC